MKDEQILQTGRGQVCQILGWEIKMMSQSCLEYEKYHDSCLIIVLILIVIEVLIGLFVRK